MITLRREGYKTFLGILRGHDGHKIVVRVRREWEGGVR